MIRFSFVLFLLFTSCVKVEKVTDRIDLNSNIAGIKASLLDLHNSTMQIHDFTAGIKTKIENNREFTETLVMQAKRDAISTVNDKWTFRILGIGLTILGLSYPVGKMFWLWSAKAKNFCTHITNGGPSK